MKVWDDFLAAITFLTRLPTPKHFQDAGSLARASKFFSVVGLIVAFLAFLVYWVLNHHASIQVRCVLVLATLVVVTGGLHEEGLSDVADGFGGGWTQERILEIMRDSRIGSYGAISIGLSLLVRFTLMTNLPEEHFWGYLASAQILSRWSVLPLSFLLPPARRADGKGAAIAHRISHSSFFIGTAITVLLCLALLRFQLVAPLLCSIAAVFISGAYYKRRIGGVTGDCFGATIQIVETLTYLCGALY